MIRICGASPALLTKIDAVLDGDDSVAPKPEPPLATCTITSAARRLKISRPTLYRMIKSGRVRTVPLNGVSRVLIESLVQLAYSSNK